MDVRPSRAFLASAAGRRTNHAMRKGAGRRRSLRAVALLELCIVTPLTIGLALIAFDFGNGVLARQRAAVGAQQTVAVAAAAGGTDVLCAQTGDTCAQHAFEGWKDNTSGMSAATVEFTGPERCGSNANKVLTAKVNYQWKSWSIATIGPLIGVVLDQPDPIIRTSTAAAAACEVRR